MPSERKVQTSWSAGEIDAVAEGRPDTKVYDAAGREVRNTLPLVTGGVTTRPGTLIELIGDTSSRRVLRFMFNLTQRYLFVATTSALVGYVVNADDSLGAGITLTGGAAWWSSLDEAEAA